MPSLTSLAAVELQLVMHCCDRPTRTSLSRCSRYTLSSASHPFAWKHCEGLHMDITPQRSISTLDREMRRRRSLLRFVPLDVRCVSHHDTPDELREDLERLAHLPNLVGLTLPHPTHVLLGADNVHFLVQGLMAQDSARRLTALNLSDNGLDDAAVPSLLTLLAHAEHPLRTLSLSFNDFSPHGVAQLAPACSSLTRLDLAGNHVSILGARALADTIRSNSHLARLDLQNGHIPVEGLMNLLEACRGGSEGSSGGREEEEEGSSSSSHPSARARAPTRPSASAMKFLDLRFNAAGIEVGYAVAELRGTLPQLEVRMFDLLAPPPGQV